MLFSQDQERSWFNLVKSTPETQKVLFSQDQEQSLVILVISNPESQQWASTAKARISKLLSLETLANPNFKFLTMSAQQRRMWQSNVNANKVAAIVLLSS